MFVYNKKRFQASHLPSWTWTQLWFNQNPGQGFMPKWKRLYKDECCPSPYGLWAPLCSSHTGYLKGTELKTFRPIDSPPFIYTVLCLVNSNPILLSPLSLTGISMIINLTWMTTYLHHCYDPHDTRLHFPRHGSLHRGLNFNITALSFLFVVVSDTASLCLHLLLPMT